MTKENTGREDIEAGEILKDRYRIVKVLGEGALGRTMLAEDTSRGDAHVAVKELLPSRMKRWKDYDLFHRECRTLQSLDHEGIPEYLEDFVIDSEAPSEPPRLFLVQAYVEGRSLQDILDERLAEIPPDEIGSTEVFDEEEVRDIMRQTLEILDYLHNLNPQVIHRDLKPANLMLTPDGDVVLIDFGAVREAVTFDGIGSTIVGTFGYMPPEQYAGKSSPATDLFALGATSVQLLTGRPPGELFEGIHEFNIPADLPVTLGFERVLLRLTEPEEKRRYQTAEDVVRDLSYGFLMVKQDAVTGDLPIPHEIRPHPRPYPGFYLRDAYHGMSHLAVIIISVVGIFLTLVFPVTAIVTNQAVWSILGFFATVAATGMAVMVSKKARNEVNVYREGQYTLGEVTGRFLSASSQIGTNLTYRYRVGEGFRHGCISTRDSSYRSLLPGDPVGVIYLPDEPEEHVLYAVPADWSTKQAVGLSHRLTHDPAGGGAS